MSKPNIKNLEELVLSGYKSKSIKQELSDNLSKLIKSGKPTFSNIYGYEVIRILNKQFFQNIT